MLRTRRILTVDRVLLAVTFGACACFLFGMGGCAAGRGPGGEVIVGLDVAKLPETTGEFANAAAKFLPPPFDLVAGGVLTALGLGGAGAYARRQQRRDRDESWDEATRATELASAQRDAQYDEAYLRGVLAASQPVRRPDPGVVLGSVASTVPAKAPLDPGAGTGPA